MERKICTHCKEEKPITEFYKQKDRKSLASKCKKCHNEYCIQRWKQRKIDAVEYKGGKCIDCGLTHPEKPAIIFDFHHLDPNKKDVDWGKLRLRSWDAILKELNKCVLLCGNCHRIRHYVE